MLLDISVTVRNHMKVKLTSHIPYLIRVTDLVIIISIGFLSIYIKNSTPAFGLKIDETGKYYWLISGILIVYVTLSGELYRSWRGVSIFVVVKSVASRWLATCAFILAVLYTLKISDEFSRIWFFVYAFSTLCSLILFRYFIYIVMTKLREKGFNRKKVAIIGDGEVVFILKNRTEAASWAGYDVLFHIHENNLESASSLDSFALDEIWVSLRDFNQLNLNKIVFNLRHTSANIRYIPEISAVTSINQGYTEVIGVPMIDIIATRIYGFNAFLKAAEDYILSAMALILFSPLMLVVALALKLESPGSRILFLQKRHGASGEQFYIYKFRSMKNSDNKEAGFTQTVKNDPRVTKIGSFIRRTSIDELPQLFNVLRGEMSMVGPRPHAIEHNDQFKDYIISYMKRHLVKPGITGWAQVNGFRGETETIEKMKGRIEHDIYYIENWSILFDLRILCITAIKGFMGPGVY